ncbi:phosphatase PAP2 family protein [Actinospica sp. MGRD01-02]|uniref:Phosphatase PAP2 family protein n=1 Tax=Actinospica acidithermotolerans TaxID=2828514 RepID=A0A941E9F3_9ACTN|nr:phosphatase PAP2 family protein [Actinospica acidithermotolerans]MBR7826433.1 phosphatase PAP2 family protein [Actinospica acidithermotolerans]
MPNIMWTWQQAAAVAGVLAAVWGVLKARGAAPRARPFVYEAALIILLYGLWQLVGSLSGGGDYSAISRAKWIWNAERSAGLPSERTLQGWILPHPILVQAANLYYATMHFTVLIVFLVWLFSRHRDLYGRWRTVLALLTLSCLLIQFLPVAPPRMVPSTGMVDTAVVYHQSVYGTMGGFEADALSAMPSVHVGWAVLVAIAVCSVTKSRWRALAVLHAALTVFVVVVTGNHFWADGIVACVLLLAALGAERTGRRLWQRAATRAVSTDSPESSANLVDVA